MKKKAKKSAGKKAGPKKSVGDRLFEKNLADLRKEAQGDEKCLVLIAEMRTVRQLLDVSLSAKAVRSDTVRIRRIMEAEIAARDTESDEILSRLEDKLL